MLQRVARSIRFVESLLATAAYAAVAIILMADIVGREIFGHSFLGAQQVAVYGAIIAGFLGLTIATSDDAHLRPKFLDFLLRRQETLADRVGNTVSGMFFVAGAYIAWTFVAISMNSGDRAPVLYFFVWPLQMVIPYAFLSAGLKHLIFAIDPGAKTVGLDDPAHKAPS